ncbi:hypothetical protein J2X76_002621 [Neorhizobium sp. 2083]|nr:hypothetical protein [Neorhizobium sp. 2083]MDR6817445.1 hypothetical protein [Neorhizobium sp. 2083]
MARIEKNGLALDETLYDFLVTEALPGTGVDADRFFSEFSKIVHNLAPKNRDLLAKRDAFQLTEGVPSRRSAARKRQSGTRQPDRHPQSAG